MEEIVRYTDSSGTGVGVRRDGALTRIAGASTLAELLQMPVDDIRALVETAAEPLGPDARLLAPVDEQTEVWGGGVTYERSRAARIEESTSSDVYDRVYLAERPELFFKAPAWRVRTDRESIGIRRDSRLNVPEPELALWVTASGEIAGYLVCNDMTSRSIEAANPLYLPQAKVYADSCALSTGIVPRWHVADPESLAIRMTISRRDAVIWNSETSTASMARSFEELVSWLYAEMDFPAGVILSTGTGIVPELDFVLESGDTVSIEIDGVGALTNLVEQRGAAAELSGVHR